MKCEKKRLPHLTRRSVSGVPSGTVVLKIINDTMALLKIIRNYGIIWIRCSGSWLIAQNNIL